MDPFPKILSFLSLNPGTFSIQDAPPDMSEWDNDDINPRLDFLINQIRELVLRHASVRAHLPIPGYDNTTNTLPAPAAVSTFKSAAHTRDFNVALLPFLELTHEFRQKTRHNHFIKTLQSRGHHYDLTYNKSFLVLRRQLLRNRKGPRSQHHFRRNNLPLLRSSSPFTELRSSPSISSLSNRSDNNVPPLEDNTVDPILSLIFPSDHNVPPALGEAEDNTVDLIIYSPSLGNNLEFLAIVSESDSD